MSKKGQGAMAVKRIVEKALEQGQGVLRLAPNWVPRSFCVPGRRIKLHPDDYYAMGGERGGIDERWFASTTPADNGPLTSPNEGLSFVVFRGWRQDRAGPPARRGRGASGRDHRRSDLEEAPTLAHVLEVLRQQGRPAAPHPPSRQAREAHGPDGQARGVLLPAPGQQLRRQFPLHLLRPQSRHDEGRGPSMPGWISPRATTRSRASRGPTVWTSAPAGTSRRACCTRRAACAPTSRRRRRMSSPCTRSLTGDQIVPERTALEGYAQE